MVTPRNQRYKRKVNSALDLAKMAAANDPKQVYEKNTKSFVETKPGFGPFNDLVNVSGLLRFGKENLAAQTTAAFQDLKDIASGQYKFGKNTKNIIRANDKYGQSQSMVEQFGLNALENLLTGRAKKEDIKQLGYAIPAARAPLTAYDVTGMNVRDYFVSDPIAKVYENFPIIKQTRQTRKALDKILSYLD
jgi:hypothetical protein